MSFGTRLLPFATRCSFSECQVPQLAVHEMMERQVNHMVRLVDDLLEISRITRGAIDLRLEQVDLATIVGNAVETSRPLMEASGHNLSISLPALPLILLADPVRLAQVIANLLNNAAKYTENAGNIQLTIRRDGNEAVVSVRDSGLGIPADMLDRVFDMFAQIDRTLKRAQGGLGIGLTLARSLVEMHGGSIDVQSEGLGKGSEFTVRLPIDPLPITFLEKAASTGKLSEPVRCPCRVLVVDDNRDAADSLGMLLKFIGAEPQIVYTGTAALEALRNYRPAIVLLDIGMPGMDGHEVAKRIRQEAGFEQIKLIALTGWGQEEDVRRSRNAGFNHHLVKPVDMGAASGSQFLLCATILACQDCWRKREVLFRTPSCSTGSRRRAPSLETRRSPTVNFIKSNFREG